MRVSLRSEHHSAALMYPRSPRIDPNRVLQSFRCILCHGGLAVVWVMNASQLPLNQIEAIALKCAKDTLRNHSV